MTALVVALLLVSQPGLLPRKPRSPQSGASKGPVLTPGQIPEGPEVPPVILDDSPPPPSAAPAPAQPPPAPTAGPEDVAPAAPAPGPAAPVPPRARPALPSSETGQWVYTQQYGWLWMAYDDAYCSLPPTGRGRPYAYVYHPNRGWTWVEAPWMWGIGPWPQFGVRGPWRFAWYKAGAWRTPWRWQYLPATPRVRSSRAGA